MERTVKHTPKNLLVTGGAGFIGSNFVHYWLEQYPDERIFDEEIEFRGGAFYPVCDMPESDFEIIGNIYENPKLIG